MITPQDIREKTFEKAMFGGYDMGGIDEFLEEVANDVAALQKENAVLKGKMKVGAVAKGNSVLGSLPCGEFLFQLHGDIGAGEITAADHFQRGVLIFFGDDGPLKEVILGGVSGDDGGTA